MMALMKILSMILAAAIFVPAPGALRADDSKESPSYRFEFKVAKQRKNRVKKGGSANSSTSEVWNYKIEVGNNSLQDLGPIEVKYTCYISTETRSGGSRKETTRKVSGEGTLAPIPRGNRSTLETRTAALKQSETTERKKSNKKRGNNNSNSKKAQIKVTEVREKLDGISIQLFLKGKQVGEHVLGDAAKRAAAKKK